MAMGMSLYFFKKQTESACGQSCFTHESRPLNPGDSHDLFTLVKVDLDLDPPARRQLSEHLPGLHKPASTIQAAIDTLRMHGKAYSRQRLNPAASMAS